MRTIYIMICMAAVLASAGCTPAAKDNADSRRKTDVAALVGEEAITTDELEQAARSRLQRVEMKRYRIKRRVLDELIEKRLIAAAAAAAGMSVEAYRATMIDDRVTQPTDGQLRAVYDTRKGARAQPFDEVKPQIAAYVKRKERMRLREQLVDQLRSAADIRVYLDAPRAKIELAHAPAKGPAQADVTVVEFSDYQCPFSKKARGTVARLRAHYGDKIRYVFKDFPLSFHRDARNAAVAARCAGEQGRYFAYHDLLFARQHALGAEALKSYAERLNLDMEAFAVCLRDEQQIKLVDASFKEGAAAGVSGTPAFFVNGIMIDGAQPFDKFKEIIDNELARSN